MGKDSSIEWTHHTFNPWWGCQKVSPGCEHCYAETLSNRFGYDVWGSAKTTPRREFGDKHWAEPLAWNAAAAAAGERRRIFCASMADVFEDHPQLDYWRMRLWDLIEATPHLDWLLLTKRPENIRGMLPALWVHNPMPNIWLGTSCEDQRRADERIPELLGMPAAVRFLSCEPLLGPITLFDTSEGVLRGPAVIVSGGMTPSTPDSLPEGYDDSYSGIDWVIVGGESGSQARPMHPDWARSLRDQCQVAGVAFHFKQWGEWCPGEFQRGGIFNGYWQFQQGSSFHEEAHGLPEHYHFQGPPDGRYRCWPVIRPWPEVACLKLGKRWSRRDLDGRTWDQFPGEV